MVERRAEPAKRSQCFYGVSRPRTAAQRGLDTAKNAYSTALSGRFKSIRLPKFIRMLGMRDAIICYTFARRQAMTSMPVSSGSAQGTYAPPVPLQAGRYRLSPLWLQDLALKILYFAAISPA